MKKTKYLVPVIALIILATSSLAVSAASGSGFGGRFINGSDWEGRLSKDAGILGITLPEMKAYWSDGKNLKDIAAEKGISEDEIRQKMQAQRLEQIKSELQSLVGEGKITQAQADSRLKFMQEHAGRGIGMGMGMRHKGERGQKDCPLIANSN